MISKNSEPTANIDSWTTNPEILTTPFGEGHVEISRGTANEAFHQDLLKLRKEYVVNAKRKWRSIEDEEWDRYDDNESSIHVGLRAEVDSPLEVGIRLTPIADVASSYTWEMLQNNPEMRENALQHTLDDGSWTIESLEAAGSRGNLYDLTRLVADENADPSHIINAMMELIGFAAGVVEQQTAPDELDDVRYIFLTTPTMRGVLKYLEVKFVDVTNDKVNADDNEKSYLCILEQEKVKRHIYENADRLPQSFPNFTNGLKKANAL